MAAQIGRYAHAKQFKRMRKALKALRIRVGRIHREVTRKLHELPEHVQHKGCRFCGQASAGASPEP
jgi:transposase, IS5 family